MWNRTTKTDRGSRGQVLPMAALMMVVLVAATGLAIDAGRLFVAKAQLVRAVDAAALAATLELPDLTNAQTKATTYMQQNEPTAVTQTVTSPADRQVTVTGTKTVDVIFMNIFGISSVNVSASATAGFGVLAVDTVLTIDRTISMQGDPLLQAKTAAKSFTDALLSGSVASSDTLVGVAPYSNCYQPPWAAPPGPTNTPSGPAPTKTPTPKYTPTKTPTPKYSPTPTKTPTPVPTSTPAINQYCTPGGMVIDLSNDKGMIDNKIDAITANGSTNICLGLDRAADGALSDHSDSVLFGPGWHNVTNALHIVVLLSDGQNWYTGDSFDGQGQPPLDCRPTTDPSQDDPHTGQTGSMCYSAQPRQKELDKETMALADKLRTDNVEIYVVGLSVCGAKTTGTGNPDPHPTQYKTAAWCNTNQIGTGEHDDIGNRHLLKCIASSTEGTNDHYFEVRSASDLPDAFANIARLIGFRLIK